MMQKKLLLVFASMVFLAAGAFASGALSVSLNSLDPINVGGSVTLTATVSASGDNVSNAQASITLPTGLTSSDATTQSIGTLNAGSNSSKSWNITGGSSGTYTITVSASGDSVTTQTANATLTVNGAGFITVSTTTSPASTLTAIDQTTTLALSFSNTGGSSSTVTVATTPLTGLTMTSGSSSNIFDLNAGQSSSLSWAFRMDTAGDKTISVAITSTANNPDDLSFSLTGPAAAQTTPQSPGGSDTNTNTSASPPSTDAGNVGGGSRGSDESGGSEPDDGSGTPENPQVSADLCKNVKCADKNPCTTDSCTPETGKCKFTPKLDGALCGDNKFCSAGLCKEKAKASAQAEQQKQGADNNGIVALLGGLGIIGIVVVIAALAAVAYLVFLRK